MSTHRAQVGSLELTVNHLTAEALHELREMYQREL